MIRWYAVYTQPRGEIRALENLRRQNYEVYLPRYRRWISHARRRLVAYRPLFPRYLFVGLDRDVMPWRPMLSTCGVSGVVRYGDEPAEVQIEVINTLQQCEIEGSFDEHSPGRRLKPGSIVRIVDGPFSDLIGRVVEATDEQRVSILLDLLGRSVKTQIPAAALAAA